MLIWKYFLMKTFCEYISSYNNNIYLLHVWNSFYPFSIINSRTSEIRIQLLILEFLNFAHIQIIIIKLLSNTWRNIIWEKRVINFNLLPLHSISWIIIFCFRKVFVVTFVNFILSSFNLEIKGKQNPRQIFFKHS